LLKSLAGQIGKAPTWSYAVDDCRRTYEELVAKGVKFSSPPAEQFYGIEAVCEDLYGNSISLVEPSPAMRR
jgi:predicted enzyme related to lactoylglutathione lyase